MIMSRLRRPLCQALRQSRFLPTSGTRLQSLRRSIRSRGAGLDRSQSQRLSRRLSPLRRPRRHPPGQWNRDRECRAVVGVAAVAEIVRERQVRPLSQLSPERYPQPNRLLQNRPSGSRPNMSLRRSRLRIRCRLRLCQVKPCRLNRC
jgi:hypothetical protein